jgi:hypothetical protein
MRAAERTGGPRRPKGCGHPGRHAHRRQLDNGPGRGAPAWHRGGRGRSAARTELQASGSRGRDGRRWLQRCPGPRRGRRRHRHGHRNRCRDGERRRNAAQGKPDGHRAGTPALRGDHEQYPPEPFLCVHLQRTRRASRSRCALPSHRYPVVADHRRRRHDLVISERGRQCPAPEEPHCSKVTLLASAK